jgi:hypothetical protein
VRQSKDSFVSPLHISVMSRGCFTSYRFAWDPSDFTTYKHVQERFTWRDFTDDMLGDMGECTTCQQSMSRHTHLARLMQSLPISE